MRAAAACLVAALATYLLTPLAIKIAFKTAFIDRPAGYKGHKQATPYLGGTAITIGLLAGAAVGGIPSRYALIVACAAGVWLLGTLDDKIDLPILLRVAIEVGIGIALSASGLGWTVFHQGIADAALSVLWVVGVMNAFNLMDNMDGAAATVACVSSLGAGTLALMAGRPGLAPLCFAVAGACAGFLPRNLANPSRIFMGDGGSLPLGLLVAAVAMSAVNRDYLGPNGVVIGALLVGMVILDTTLVTFSRSRAGRPVLSGGRDHLTHRLAKRVGSPRRVALTLAGSQLLVCIVTIAVAKAGEGWIFAAGGFGLVVGAVLIWQFESSPLFRPDVVVTASASEADSTDDGPADEIRAARGALALTSP
jgi:UDP-GlcNAc:undecaprenyl-phosphate/decaprenyl-phosphate GlcNAc-1-phosphate transferase